MSVDAAVIRAAELFVQQQLSHNDASHDYNHIQRVKQMALHIAEVEQLGADAKSIIELSALLHDVLDWKYGGTKSQSEDSIRAFLKVQHLPEATIAHVLDIISRVGFKEELPTSSTAAAAGGVSLQPPALPIEAAVVQDADRLDAIGAIGVARCFTFGGHFKRVLYDPAVPPRDQLTKEQYMAGGGQSTTINHFYEKLLKIKGLMKTKEGARLAAQRHAFMEAFLEQFHAECQGKA